MKRRRASDTWWKLRRAIVPAGLAAGAVVFAACASNANDGTALDSDVPHDTTASDSMTIEQALAEHTDAWMKIDGVEGTGIGLCDDEPCIKIFVSRPPEEFDGVLPEGVKGHPVRLEPTGRFEPR